MYKHYYVNTNPEKGQNHEVHADGCNKMPLSKNRSYLGYFSNCSQAVEEAKKTYSDADGCFWCSRACHIR